MQTHLRSLSENMKYYILICCAIWLVSCGGNQDTNYNDNVDITTLSKVSNCSQGNGCEQIDSEPASMKSFDDFKYKYTNAAYLESKSIEINDQILKINLYADEGIYPKPLEEDKRIEIDKIISMFEEPINDFINIHNIALPILDLDVMLVNKSSEEMGVYAQVERESNVIVFPYKHLSKVLKTGGDWIQLTRSTTIHEIMHINSNFVSFDSNASNRELMGGASEYLNSRHQNGRHFANFFYGVEVQKGNIHQALGYYIMEAIWDEYGKEYAQRFLSLLAFSSGGELGRVDHALSMAGISMQYRDFVEESSFGCTESDGGENIYEASVTYGLNRYSFRPYSIKDTCSTRGSGTGEIDHYLHEGYCNADGLVEGQLHLCSTTCSNNACD